jgi:peptidoglycan/xylan/chitin deacetylase (PgdA/CDA1 family)
MPHTSRLLRRIGMTVAIVLTAGLAAGPPALADTSPTVVSITFDDGYANTAQGLDAMTARGLKGTIYVNSQRVGYNSLFLTRNQLRTYQQNGFEIGGHSLNHEDLSALSLDAATANVCADRSNLMDLGLRVTSFAYPFGANTAETQQAVKACGYNSARLISDLRSPTSCLRCSPAEAIPPVKPYAIRTPASIRAAFTLDDVKGMVTQAETGGGGWVPLVFHQICDGCSTNAITPTDFVAFLDWLKERPESTVVKTVDQVIGGSLQPEPIDPEPVPEEDAVIIGSQSRTIDGINSARTTNALILYTRVRGTTTGTNSYGTEVAVVNNVVTKVENNIGNMAIPTGGVVLSGHGTSATWLKNYAKVGVTVQLTDSTTLPPPPPPVVTPTTQVTIGAATRAIDGVDVARKANFLVIYTSKTGSSTGTNQYGFEAAVVDGVITKIDGVITKIENGVGNMDIPANGYVLSGHGTARTWLLANATVGATVTG